MKELKLIYGAGEIPRIDKQIKQAFKILAECPFRQGGVSSNKINKICDLGFDHEHSSGETFIGERQVIKLALFTRRPPPLKYRVPTMLFTNEDIKPNNFYWDYVLAIQPKVTGLVEGEEDEVKWIDYFESKLTGTDFHAGNFGYYKGEVKLFDW